VCVTGNKSLIASSNEFNDFQNLIDELERFGTQWEATEDGVVVAGNRYTLRRRPLSHSMGSN